MSREPVVVREDERGWEVMGNGTIEVLFKTLISGGLTRSEALTLGLSAMPPGGTLSEHRHRQAKVYLVLSGSGCVRVDGEEAPIEAGSAVFIPGGALHSCENTGTSELRVAYILSADSFED